MIVLGIRCCSGGTRSLGCATINAPIFRNPFADGVRLRPAARPDDPAVRRAADRQRVRAWEPAASRSLADSLGYTLAFGLGFGWPLILLPLLAVPAQRHLTRWLAGRYGLLTRASGLILIGIGLFGLWAEALGKRSLPAHRNRGCSRPNPPASSNERAMDLVRFRESEGVSARIR